MMYWGVTFPVWVKSLTQEEREEYKEMFKEYDNPLLKAFNWVWKDEE